ncbi:ribose-phosphate pyrophosphokinase [Candidatus Mycoplasma haematobovis]|uniref:ribose-phosphate diphosphokinase n=1 Tax=Candidatus Mycoplasma haematobovis TaxID=432608 RepID=A0A1A9QEA7_9MOLU|nr:ribose-phosphate diphosphokinase [Candidatus Mycoplasma haematobovis]OAL10286.1 ribose-phosphate pyrophosphokinase [Candidatus Mycoplasma haematobovis]
MSNLFFSLSKDNKLAEEVVKHLGLKLSEIQIMNFADGETFAKPLVSVRNKNVFIIHSTTKPINENLMALLIALDSFKRALAKEINVVFPYLCYARQDRKLQGREPITSRLVADLLTTAGATRVLLVEIHSNQIQGFFNIPADTVTTIYPIAEHIVRNISVKDLSIVSPDFGGLKRAKALNKLLNTDLLIIDKERETANECKAVHVLGEVKGKNCLIIDDILDTGGTLLVAAKILKEKGANKVMIVVSHALFSRNALENFKVAWERKIVEKIYITNTLEFNSDCPFIEVISISEFLSKVINMYMKNKGSLEEIYQEYEKNIKQILS